MHIYCSQFPIVTETDLCGKLQFSILFSEKRCLESSYLKPTCFLFSKKYLML